MKIAKYFSANWFVSPRYDGVFFIGSVTLSFLFMALHKLIASRFEIEAESGFFTFVVFTAFFDMPHILQTFSRSHLDQAEFQRHHYRIRYGLYLFIAMGFLVAAMDWGWPMLYAGGAYGIWHIYRQNIGFMGLYKRMNADNDLPDRIIDHGLYVTILLAGLTRETENAWVATLADLFRISFYLLILAFVVRQIQRLHSKKPLNLPKILFMSATLSVYYALFQLFQVPVLAYIAIETAYHDLQYQGWMVHFQKRRFPQAPSLWKKWMIATLASGVALTILGIPALSTLYLETKLVSERTAWYLFAPFFMVILYHYYIDGIIWKFSQAPELYRLLPSAPRPTAINERKAG